MFDPDKILRDFSDFSEDLIGSLISNIADYELSQDDYKLFPYRLAIHPHDKRSHITPEVEKAVHTLAYLYRFECLSVFNRMPYTMEGKQSFEDFVLQLTIPDDNYYLCLLAWMAFLYELTMRCFLHKFNHTKTSLKCMKRFTNLRYFQDDEQWNKFIETANRVARFYEPVVESLGDSFPDRDILGPFQFTLKETLRLYRYKLNVTKLMMFRDPAVGKSKRSSKLRCLWRFNPEQITFGHTVLRRNKSALKTTLSSEKNSTVSGQPLYASEVQPDPDIEMADVQCLGGLSTSSAASNENVSGSKPSPGKENLEVDAYKNSAFVITDKYRENRKYDKNDYKDGKYFKIFSTSEEKLERFENLNSTLEQNIKAGNMQQISRELFVVPKLDIRDIRDGKEIIVVDSSSDEEDDEFDSFQRSFVNGVLQRWKKFSLDDVEMMHFVLKSRFWEPRLHRQSASIQQAE